MLIIWGSKTLRRNAGFAADYCTVCRVPAPMEITEHRRVRTIYFVPMGQGRPYELWAQCPDCASRFVRPVGHYANFADQPGAFEDLVGWTNPSLMSGVAFRERAEAAAMAGEAEPEDRLALFAEIIGSLEAEAVHRQVSGRYESATAVIAVVAVGASGVGAVLAVTAPPVWAWSLGALAAVFWVWLIYRTARGQSKARARSVEQRIARTIAPYDPTDDELRVVRRKLARARSTVAKGLDLVRLRALIESELGTTVPE